MLIRLEVSDGGERQAEFEHAGPRIPVGRDPACELPLRNDGNDGVSWRHASIDLGAGGAVLRDLESTNGTFLNDRRVDEPARLKIGDYVRLGRSGPYLKILAIDQRMRTVLEKPSPLQTEVLGKAVAKQSPPPLPAGNGPQEGGKDPGAVPTPHTERKVSVPAQGALRRFLAPGRAALLLLAGACMVALAVLAARWPWNGAADEALQAEAATLAQRRYQAVTATINDVSMKSGSRLRIVIDKVQAADPAEWSDGNKAVPVTIAFSVEEQRRGLVVSGSLKETVLFDPETRAFVEFRKMSGKLPELDAWAVVNKDPAVLEVGEKLQEALKRGNAFAQDFAQEAAHQVMNNCGGGYGLSTHVLDWRIDRHTRKWRIDLAASFQGKFTGIQYEFGGTLTVDETGRNPRFNPTSRNFGFRTLETTRAGIGLLTDFGKAGLLDLLFGEEK